MKEILKGTSQFYQRVPFDANSCPGKVLRYYQLLSDFSKGPLKTVNAHTLRATLYFSMIGFGLVATILRRSLVQDSPKMKMHLHCCWDYSSSIVVLGYVGMASFIQEGLLYSGSLG